MGGSAIVFAKLPQELLAVARLIRSPKHGCASGKGFTDCLHVSSCSCESRIDTVAENQWESLVFLWRSVEIGEESVNSKSIVE